MNIQRKKKLRAEMAKERKAPETVTVETAPPPVEESPKKKKSIIEKVLAPVVKPTVVSIKTGRKKK